MPNRVRPFRARKKPVTVRVAGPITEDNWGAIARWCGGQKTVTDHGIAVSIPTLEGLMTASAGDLVIKGIEGEFYPIKPDIFWRTYEAL